jgi:hypothetical protein
MPKMERKADSCLPSDLLQHVYTFLVRCNYVKAAKALQKATTEVRWVGVVTGSMVTLPALIC